MTPEEPDLDHYPNTIEHLDMYIGDLVNGRSLLEFVNEENTNMPY
jgi:hypothetical protein